MKRSLFLVPTVIMAIVILAGVGVVNAAAVSERFCLSEHHVLDVVDEVKADRFALKHQWMEEKYDEAVAKGYLTEAQKLVLIEKKMEMKEEFEDWTEENDISLPELLGMKKVL